MHSTLDVKSLYVYVHVERVAQGMGDKDDILPCLRLFTHMHNKLLHFDLFIFHGTDH